jgi:Spy/CpxP family protein refolding chaperone
MKKLAVALVAALSLPLAAAAQAGSGPGMGRGPGKDMMHDHKRAKVALTLGLAEALDLDEAQTFKLRETVDRFAQRREPLMLQQHDAMQVLRAAASSEKPDAGPVDQAIAKLHDARTQIQALDREFFAAVTKDLPAQKKARAVLFLGKFHARMARHVHGGPPGRHGPGMGGEMHPMGPGMGPGMGGGRTELAPPGEPGEEMGMLDEGPEEDEL